MANTGPARFTSRYTEAQKTAILRAVCIDGHTVRQATRMASAGQLEVPAFDIGHYAYDIVKDGRDAFEARDEDALAAAIASELHRAEIDALANVRNTRRTLKKGEANDTARLAQAVKDLASIRRSRRDAVATFKPKATNEKTPGREPETPKGDPTLKNLLGLAPKGTPKAADDAPKPNTGEGAGTRFAHSPAD